MDNERYIEFGPEDSNGNVLVTMGKVDAYEAHRTYLLEQVSGMYEQTWAVLAKKKITDDQIDVLEHAAEMLYDLRDFLDSESV